MTSTNEPKRPNEILERPVQQLEHIYQDQRSPSNRQSKMQERKFSLSNHAGSGGIIAVLIATL